MFFYSRLDHRHSRKRRSEAQKKLEGRFIITEVGPDGEPIAPEAAAKKLQASGSGKLPIQARNGMRYPKEKKNGAGGSLRKTLRFQLNPKIYASTGP